MSTTNFSIFVHAVEHLLGDELLEVRDGGLRGAADEAALERAQRAGYTLQAHVHLQNTLLLFSLPHPTAKLPFHKHINTNISDLYLGCVWHPYNIFFLFFLFYEF